MRTIGRIFGDWLHWKVGPFCVGYHRHGNCWRFVPRWARYANHHDVSLWRFFITFPRHRNG